MTTVSDGRREAMHLDDVIQTANDVVQTAAPQDPDGAGDDVNTTAV
jgi:hypothetical protein